MDYQLSGRVAVVNAASRGLGRGIAEALAAERVRLVITSRDEQAVCQAASEISQAHAADVVPVVADVAVVGAAERAVGAAIESYGALDILITNSGGPPGGGFADFDDAAWREAFDLLLLSVIRMVRVAMPYLSASGHGRIVNVASSSVREPIPGLILSNAMRAAVASLAKTLSGELAPDQITVNTVLPGRILTDRLRGPFIEPARSAGVSVDELARAEVAREVPLGRVGEPSDMGNLVAFLCSDAAAYLTGLAVPVDGGRLRAVF
ncbi:MAG TPA: SDR family oxidoreductase [Streptosporangiaceae bacterium]|nr:SDR family oxidoreductase [Streptosporangiaceae bacterium]